jgi:hypothetical protein
VRLSERTLAGLDRARKQGRVGGRPRIKRERDKDAKRIRQLREDGQSYTEIAECEARRFRKCKRGDCPHPYFIAGHLKQKFCCEKCAEWGQRQWKTAWWREHGESWRREKRRQQELKGRKNAQKKAK